jgi:glycosyltransferase involved in cell wall biosynthesis
MSVRFSVVMPVFNRAKYLPKAIESVFSQTFTDYELIAVDDGSTDDSFEILKSYGSRIRVIRQANQGPEVARNTGVAQARGEYIAFLDSDDIFFPFALEMYDRVIQAFDSPPLVVSTELYYRDGQEIPRSFFEPQPAEVLVFKDYLSKTVSVNCIQSKLAIRKSVYAEVGGHRHSTARTWYGDTFDLLLRIGTYGPCIFIQKPRTFAYRVHDENSIKQIRSHAAGMLSLVREERAGQYPGGSRRRWDRYAIIGGTSANWAWKYCWRGGQRKLALQLLLGTAPMVLAAVVKKTLRYLRKPPQPIALPDAKSAVMAPSEESTPVGT